MGRKRWVVTDEVLEALKEANRKGETILSVSKRFNIRYLALQPYAKRLGLNFLTGTKEGTPYSLERGRKISDTKRGPDYLSRRAAVIGDYLKDKDQAWAQLAERYGFTEVEVKIMIGEHLIAACRSDAECPWKPLLPEYKVK